MDKKILTNEDVSRLAADLAEKYISKQLNLSLSGSPAAFPTIYGIPRGGIAVAYAFAQAYAQRVKGARPQVVDIVTDADVIIDDIMDSGATMRRTASEARPDKVGRLPFFCALLGRPERSMTVSVGERFATGVAVAGTTYEWVVFPWEGSEVGSAEDIPVRLLQFLGEDPNRGGLHETPRRVLKAWKHWTSGYEQDPKSILKVFEDGAEKCDEMVIVRSIPIYSHCEHHLAAIFGIAHIAYIPNGKIVGLSKLSRLADIFARRLQVQERLTNQIADALDEHLKPRGVGVIIEARHMCMESRGVCQQGHSTRTSALRGVLKTDQAAREEFMRLALTPNQT